MGKRYRRIELVSPAEPLCGGPIAPPRVFAKTAAPGFGRMSCGRVLPNETPVAGGLGDLIPVLARGIDVRVFEDFMLSTVTSGGTFVLRAFSDALPTFGNAITVGLTVQKSSGAATVVCTLQASIERRIWLDVASATQADFGYAEVTSSAFYYPWIRLALELSGTAQWARVDVDVSQARW